MKKTTTKTAVLLVLATMVLAGQALAGPGGRGRGPRGGPAFGPGAPGPCWGIGQPMRLGRMLGPCPVQGLPWLDLTDEQIEAIRQIHETNREAMQAAQEAVAEATKALHEAVLQNNEADIQAAATNLGSAIGQGALLRAATMASIKAVLTPEQQTELEQLQSRRRQRVGDSAQEMQRLGLPGAYLGFRHQRGAGPGAWPGFLPMGSQRRGRGPGWGLDIDRLFELRDTDQDGKLTLEELQAGGISCNLATEEVFSKIDTDGDGALSVEELEKFKAQLPARLGRPW